MVEAKIMMPRTLPAGEIVAIEVILPGTESTEYGDKFKEYEAG